MRRRLLQLLTALSLLLALATAGLWGRSWCRADLFRHDYATRDLRQVTPHTAIVFAMLSQRGSISLRVRRVHGYFEIDTSPDSTRSDPWRFDGQHAFSQKSILGVLAQTEEGLNESRIGTFVWAVTTIQFPHWFLVLLFSLLPAVRVIRWQVRRRRARHLGPDARPCPACGYDRRASAGRCPECGRAVEVTKVSDR